MHNYDFDLSDAHDHDEWFRNIELRKAKKELEKWEDSFSEVRYSFQNIMDVITNTEKEVDFDKLVKNMVAICFEIGVEYKGPTMVRDPYYTNKYPC